MLFLGLLGPHSVVTVSYRHIFHPSTCLVDIKPENSSSSNITADTFQIIECYNSRCCKDGCCPKDLDFTVIGIVCLVLILIVVLNKLGHYYCGNVPGNSNNFEENVLATPTTHFDYSCNHGLQTYGTSHVELTILPVHKENDCQHTDKT